MTEYAIFCLFPYANCSISWKNANVGIVKFQDSNNKDRHCLIFNDL